MHFLTKRWTFQLYFQRTATFMYSLSYHAFDDTENRSLNKCNRSSNELPLMVNCAGNISTTAYFNTDNLDGRNDYYLMYIVSGKLSLSLTDGWTVCSAGDFIIFPPKTRYRYTHADNFEINYLWVHFTGSSAESLLNDYAIPMYPNINHIQDDGNILMRFRNMFDAFAKQDRFRDNELSILLNRLLISLARRVSGENSYGKLLHASISYINAAYNTNLRVPYLAKMENLSVSRYNTIFRKIMNMSPVEYITKMRVSSACELLVGTDLSIREIGLLVGYSDSHFFSRIFRANVGVSPTDYRKFV